VTSAKYQNSTRLGIVRRKSRAVDVASVAPDEDFCSLPAAEVPIMRAVQELCLMLALVQPKYHW
jgi:hypothetical protein